jgi:hypothetical protein
MIRHVAAVGCCFFALVAPARAAAPPTLTMQVSVQPNPLRADTAHASVRVVTQPLIICVAFVIYDNGLLPLTFQHALTQVTSVHGIATWAWSDSPRAAGGTASVSCTAGAVTRTVNVHFKVLPAAAARTQRHDDVAPFTVHAEVAPNPLRDSGSLATLTAHTSPGARCVAGVFYDDGQAARAFAGYPQVATHGDVSWRWRVQTSSAGGTGTVSCTLRGATGAATAVFAVKRA